MAYHGTTNMRCLPTYIHALSHYESVKPLRGTDVRPLESRRKKHVTIRLGADKDVIIRQHNTDVLTYKADGTVIVNNGGWASMTTHELINTVSPLDCTGHNSETWVSSYFDTPTGRTSGFLPLRNNVQEEFRYDAEKNHWLRVNPLFPKVGAINREAAKRVRDKYAQFKAYALGCLKLLGEGNRFEKEAFVDTVGNIYTGKVYGGQAAFERLQALMLSDDPEDNFKALLSLISPYHNQHKDFPVNFNDVILMLHADEMVTTREVYTGERVVNKYKRYTG